MIDNFLRATLWYQLSLAAFFMAALAYMASIIRPRSRVLKLASTGLFCGGLLLSGVFLVDRWVEAARPPFKTLFESMMLFIFCTALIYVIVERYARLAILGLLTCLFLLAFYVYSASKMDLEIIDLPAALQSGWFIPHVVVYFIGYGALFLGAVIAALSLLKPESRVTFHNVRGDRRVRYFELMHSTVVFGFVLITAGLLIGALWAKTAWGDYWTWDPKENWSLITWLIYVIYMHLKYLPGWGEKRLAWFGILGFAAVMFTYLGMSMLPTAEQSEHVYQ